MIIKEAAKAFVSAALERLEGDWEPTADQTPIAFATQIISAEQRDLAIDDDYRLPIDLSAAVFAEALLQAMAYQWTHNHEMLAGVVVMIRKDGRCGTD